VVRARRVHALRRGEVALGIGALVDVLAGGDVGEGGLLATGDDVGALQAETLVAADGGAVLEVVGPRHVLHEAVLDLGEVVAAHARAGGDGGGPGAVGLAEEGGEAGPLVAGVALVADDGAVVEALARQLVGRGVFNLRQRRTLRGCNIKDIL